MNYLIQIRLKIVMLVVLTLSLYSCKDKYEEEYSLNVPVYMSWSELRSSVETNTNRPIEVPGKIYFKGDYLYINEFKKGIHIIDNSDKTSPQNVVFVEIPGNVDIAIKDNFLYADSYTDLVVLDISDLTNIKEVKRLEKVFPYLIPETNNKYHYDNIDEDKGVVVSWEVKRERREVAPPTPIYYFDTFTAEKMNSAGGLAGAAQYGTGGSMAKFLAFSNVLYTIDNSKLTVFDINTASAPVKNSVQYMRWGIETIYPYNNNLFVGSQTGMLIYDISNPFAPEYISSFDHWRACDPVVVEGNTAYVTLRSGTACQTTLNQLDVIDISTIKTPKLYKSYPMDNPHGLGIDNGTLFICDGDSGLKIYNASDPMAVTSNHIKTFKDINASDVIPVNGVLFMIGSDGFYQYDYSDLNNIKLLSKIPVIIVN